MTLTADITARHDSLHELGTDISGATKAEDGLRLANLTNWNVRTEQSYTADGRKIPGGRYSLATIPDRGEVIFGQVGKSYKPVQTEAFGELFDVLARESGATFDAALTTNNDSRVMVSMKMPETLTLGGIDPMNVQLVGIINHLTGSNRLSAIPFRPFCANQQPQVLAEGDDLFVLRHTAGAGARLDRAGAMLTTVGDRLAEFQTTAESMLATKMSEEEFLSRARKLFPQGGKTQTGETRHKNTIESLRVLFSEAETQEPIRWTAWAGYQAVIEYYDHVMGTRKAADDFGSTPAKRRAMRAISGATAGEKLAALEMFSNQN